MVLHVSMLHETPLMAPTAMSLCNIRTSFTSLVSLAIGLRHSWQATPLCWQELGRLTHLKTLAVEFWVKVTRTSMHFGVRRQSYYLPTLSRACPVAHFKHLYAWPAGKPY